MATQQIINDPWETAENPQTSSFSEIWGLCEMQTWFCVLEKGVGKSPFKPGVHKDSDRRTAVDIHITPLADMNSQFAVERGLISESKDWAGTVLPSIKDLGVSVRELSGRYVKIEFAPTGKTYVNKSGETKSETVIRFVKLFKDEAECRADYLATKAGDVPPAQAPAAESTQKSTALQFLKVIVQNAAKGQSDLTVVRNAVATQIAGYPVVSAHFTVDSPETMQMIVDVMAGGK